MAWKLRIVQCGERYQVEKRCFLRWRPLPDYNHWVLYESLRFSPEYIKTYESVEAARAGVERYLVIYGKRTAISRIYQ